MKKLIIALISLLSFVQVFAQNDTTQYIYYRFSYGNALDRYWGKKVLMIPADTIWSKDGLAAKAGILYVGNGTKWTAVGSGGIDSVLAATKYGVDTAKQTLRNSIATKKNNSDSLLQPGYVTHSQDDTAKQVIRNAIALKASQSALHDTAAAIRADFPSGSAGTDSSDAIDWGLRKRVVSKVRYYSPDSAKLTTKLQLQATIDSLLGVIGKKQDTSARFNLYVVADGQPGDSLLVASDSVLHQPKIRDSLDGHHTIRIDKSWVFYTQAHDTITANALYPKYDADSSRKNIYAAIGAAAGISDTTALMRKSNNLADVVNPDTARKNIAALGTKKTLGVLYSKTSWTSVAPDWSYTGASGDTSIVLGKIQLVNGNQTIGSGTNSAFNKVLKLAAYGGTLLPYVEIGVKFHISSTLSSSSSGIAVGQPSTSTLGSLSNMMGYYNTTTTGTQAGSLILGTTNTNAATTPQSFPYNQNDELLIVTKRRYDKVDLYVKNLTTDSTSATVTFQWDGTNASAINAPNTGMFGIAYLGGTVTIDSVGISSETPFRPNLYLGTDSKGFYTAPTDGSFGWWMQNLFPGTVIAAGPTDVSADLLKRTKEIYSIIQPKQAFLASFPRNDTAFGIARTTWAPNIITVDTMLTNHGIPTFWADAIFENQVNQISTSVFMQTQFGNRCIRLLKLGNSSMVSGDNIHENYIGSRVYAMGVYYSKKLVHYEDVLNSLYKTDDRREFFIDTLRAQTIHMDFGAYHAAALTLGDIGMKEGGALRWAFGSSAQQTSIRQNTTNAALDFQNDIGGTQINNAPAFRFIASSGNTTGTVGNVTTIDEDGGIAAINPGIRPSILARWMAIRTYINHGFWGGNLANTDSSFAGYVPYDSTSGSWMWNPSPIGNFKIYVSGGTHGGMAQAFRIYPTKKTEISDTLLTPKWPNKSSLAGTDSLDVIDASGIHYKIPVGLVAGSDPTKKDKADSITGPGYTTIANKNKLADSLMGVINTLLALKRDIADTAGPNGTARNGHLHQVIDSLVGTFSSGSSPIIFSATAAGTPLVNSTSTASIVGTGVGSATIAANALTVGKTISVHGWFKLSTDATNTDINIFFLIGSVGLATPLTLPPSLGNTYCEINVTGTILSTGSSGTVVWMGTFTPFTSGTITPVIFTASPTVSTLNTTISNLVDIKAAWTTAMSGNSIGMLPIFTVKVQ